MLVKPRQIENGYFCIKCGNHHYAYGVIGTKHKKYKLKIQALRR